MARRVDIDARIAVATCANSAEASMLKSLLRDQGIHANVSGEHHAALLGGLGGAAISLQLQVAVKDADEARRLVAEARKGVDVSDEALEAEAMAAGAPVDADALAYAQVAALSAPQESLQALSSRLSYRRRVAIGALVSCCITFGTGHMVAGAWLRAMLLAGIEVLGLRYLAINENIVGTALTLGAIAFDLVGSQIVLRRAAKAAAIGTGVKPAALPQARTIVRD
ncbi:MAG: DUF2007 domain-containing protein [Kofleriaceae bacterium]|nr:DUF2007 domain-containing protein [Kofleriaceae bacterium]